MPTKTITIRMPEELAEWLSGQGDSINQVIVNLLDNTRIAQAYSLNELKGRFTPEEWKFFASSLNGVLVNDQFRYNKGALIAHCEDTESLMGYASEYLVNMETLKDKIEKLAGSQVEALYSRVEQFWSSAEADLEKWSQY